MPKKKEIEKPYIVFENENLDFTQFEVKKFDRLIKKNLDIPDIAKELRRSTLETLLLYIDRVDKKVVTPVHKFYPIRKVESK